MGGRSAAARGNAAEAAGGARRVRHRAAAGGRDQRVAVGRHDERGTDGAACSRPRAHAGRTSGTPCPGPPRRGVDDVRGRCSTPSHPTGAAAPCRRQSGSGTGPRPRAVRGVERQEPTASSDRAEGASHRPGSGTARCATRGAALGANAGHGPSAAPGPSRAARRVRPQGEPLASAAPRRLHGGTFPDEVVRRPGPSAGGTDAPPSTAWVLAAAPGPARARGRSTIRGCRGTPAPQGPGRRDARCRLVVRLLAWPWLSAPLHRGASPGGTPAAPRCRGAARWSAPGSVGVRQHVDLRPQWFLRPGGDSARSRVPGPRAGPAARQRAHALWRPLPRAPAFWR